MKRNGFSLVEIVTTVTIMGILVAVGAPKYLNSLQSYRISAAAKRIANDIEYAQSIAKRLNTNQTITFSTTNSNYTLAGVSDLARHGGTFIVEIDQQPYYSTLSSVSFNNNTISDAEDLILVFDRFGIPDSGGTVTVQSGSYSKQISVDAATGKVTIVTTTSSSTSSGS